MSIFSKVTGFVGNHIGKIGFAAKAKSPEILIGLGIGLVAGGTVLACRATSKAKTVIAVRKEEIEEITNRKDECEYLINVAEQTTFTQKDIDKEYRQDRFIANVRCAWGLTKLYAPAILMEASGIACFLGSHYIMKQRNAALLAAYNATDSAYRRLKERIEEKNSGWEKTEDEERKIPKEEQDIIDQIETSDRTCGPNDRFNQYSFFFDETCDSWSPDAEQNKYRAFLCQQYLQKRLDSRGFVFLNEVREFFGMESPGPCAAGQVVGWMKSMGDTTIDLGILNGYQEGCKSFINGQSRDILITPNCHNIIYNKL